MLFLAGILLLVIGHITRKLSSPRVQDKALLRQEAQCSHLNEEKAATKVESAEKAALSNSKLAA